MATKSKTLATVSGEESDKLAFMASSILTHDGLAEPGRFILALPLAFAMLCEIADVPLENALRQLELSFVSIDTHPVLRRIVELGRAQLSPNPEQDRT